MSQPFRSSYYKSYIPNHEVFVVGDGGIVQNLTDKVIKISTRKSLDQPAGTFGINFVPDLSLYKSFNPMDYVVLRFGRGIDNKGNFNPKGPQAPRPRVVMRGFSNNVRRSYDRDADKGTPARSVTMDGQDYGKMLLITKLYYLKALEPITAITPDLALAQNFGLELANQTPTGFMSKVFDIFILNNQQAGTSDAYGSNRVGQFAKIRARLKNFPAPFRFLSTVPETEVAPSIALQPFEGSIWNLMSHYDNAPWNELFVADDLTHSYLVFRPTPWIEYTSRGVKSRRFIPRINPDGSDFNPNPSLIPGTTIFQPLYISDDDILMEDLGRSDEEIVNFLFTYGSLAIQDQVSSMVAAKGTASTKPSMTAIDNRSRFASESNPKILDNGTMADISYYGFRPKELTSEYSAELFDAGSKKSTPFLAKRDNLTFYSNLNYWALAAYHPNVLFENGTIKIKGNENAQIGTYLINQSTDEYFYIHSVQHDYTIMDGGIDFSTTLGVVRGDSFIHNRNIKPGTTPWRTN